MAPASHPPPNLYIRGNEFLRPGDSLTPRRGPEGRNDPGRSPPGPGRLDRGNPRWYRAWRCTSLFLTECKLGHAAMRPTTSCSIPNPRERGIGGSPPLSCSVHDGPPRSDLLTGSGEWHAKVTVNKPVGGTLNADIVVSTEQCDGRQHLNTVCGRRMKGMGTRKSE